MEESLVLFVEFLLFWQFFRLLNICLLYEASKRELS